jgi:hypothetical protein
LAISVGELEATLTLKNNLSAEVKKAQGDLKQASADVSNFGGQSAKSLDTATAAAKQMSAQAVPALKLVSSTAGQLETAFGKLPPPIQDAMSTLLRSVRGALEGAGASFKEISIAQEDLNDVFKTSVLAGKGYEAALVDMQKAAGGVAEVMPEAAAGIGELGLTAGTAVTIIGGLVFVAGAAAIAAVALGKKAANVGSELKDLSLVTGATVEGISDLKFAVDATGGSIPALQTAVKSLQDRMASNPKELEDGLKNIGLTIQDVQGLKFDETAVLLSNAFREAGPEIDRGATALKVFGDNGRQALPGFLGPLDDLIDKSRDLGATWTEEEVAAAKAFKLEMNLLGQEATQLAIAVGKSLLPALLELLVVIEKPFSKAVGTLGWLLSIGSPLGLADKLFPSRIELPKVSNPFEGIGDDISKQAELSERAIARLTAGIEEQGRAAKKANDEHKKYADALEAYQIVGNDYADVVGKIGNALYEGIAFDKARGQSTADLARIYHVSEATIEAVTAAEKLWDDQLKKDNARIHAEGMEELKDSIAGVERGILDAYEAEKKFEASQRKLTADMKMVERSIPPIQEGFYGIATGLENVGMKSTEIDELRVKLEKIPKKFEWGKAISESLQGAFEGGGDIEGAAKSLGVRLASSLLEGMTKEIAENIKTNSGLIDPKLGATSGHTLGIAMVAGIGAAISEASGASVGQALMGSVATGAAVGAAALAGGASIGQSLAAGLKGGVISAAIVGAIEFGKFLYKSESEKIGKDIGRDLGVNISDELAKAIEATEKLTGLQRIQASWLHLNEIIKEGGGLTAKNLDGFIAKLRDTFVFLGRGELDAAQAAEVLDENFMDFVANSTDGLSGRLSPAMVEIIKLTREWGVQSKAVDAYVSDQLSHAASGLNAVAGSFNLVTKGLTTNQDDFDRLGRISLAVFASMTASGQGFMAALAAIGPTLDALILSQAELGFTSGGTLAQLLRFREFGEANKELVASVDGLNQILIGLNNTGFLTQETFADLSSEATSTFDKLIAQGLSGDDALKLMAPTLQTLYELQEQFGFIIDDASQALLDQAVAVGIVGEAHKSVAQQQLDATKRIADATEALAKIFGADLPDEAESGAKTIKDKLVDAADSAQRAFSNIHIPPIVVPYTYQNTNNPPGPPPDVPEFTGGSGGLRNFGTGTLAMLHGSEAVVPAKEFGTGGDTSGLANALAAIEAELRRSRLTTPATIARAVRDEVQKVPAGGRR